MNIELKPIAESKVRQLGGDVCGVLVRTEDSEVMAVSEHGRCTRLDAGVMGPVVVAYDPEVCTHGDADDDAACEECIEKWTRQAASVQSGQEVEPDWSASKTLESERWKNPLLSKNDRLQIADGAVAWRECLAEMVQAMHDYEMSVDEGAPYKHMAMMDRAHALLSTPPQPEEDSGDE